MQSVSKRLDDLETTVSNNLKPISPSFRAVPPPREDKWPTGSEDPWQRPAAPSGVRVPPTSPLPAMSSTDPWGRYAQKGAVSGGDSRVDSASGSPSPTSFQDTDFCKIIAGGWETDTPRSVIKKEVAQCISQWEQAVRQQVVRTVVYGRRSRTANIILTQQPHEQARERFYAIQQAYSNKIRTSTGGSLYRYTCPHIAQRAFEQRTVA